MKALFACLAMIATWGCGSADTETSVHLVVNNGVGVPLPMEVEISVFEGTSQVVRETITRGVPAGAKTFLGDVVVFPAAGTNALRFSVQGRSSAQVVSSTAVSVAPKVGAQVEAVAVLKVASKCAGATDGTKCGDATCSANRRTLTQMTCKAGVCLASSADCPNKQLCDAATLMCR